MQVFVSTEFTINSKKSAKTWIKKYYPIKAQICCFEWNYSTTSSPTRHFIGLNTLHLINHSGPFLSYFSKNIDLWHVDFVNHCSLISPIFKNCFFQRCYINTLYRQMHYSTVVKLNIVCSCNNGVTLRHNYSYFSWQGTRKGEAQERVEEVEVVEKRSLHWKRHMRSALRCNFSSV